MVLFPCPLFGRSRKKTFPFGWHGRCSFLNAETLDWWSSWVVPPLEDWVEAELFLSERRDNSQSVCWLHSVRRLHFGVRKPNNNTITPIIFFWSSSISIAHNISCFDISITPLLLYKSLLSLLCNDPVEKYTNNPFACVCVWTCVHVQC